MKRILILAILLLAGCSDVDINTQASDFFSDRCAIFENLDCKEYKVENNTLFLELENRQKDLLIENVNVTRLGPDMYSLSDQCNFPESVSMGDSFSIECSLEEDRLENLSRMSIRTNLVLESKEVIEVDLYITLN